MNRELCPDLSFITENKMGEITQGWSHFKLYMMNEIFHLLKFQEFINLLEKYVFHLEK